MRNFSQSSLYGEGSRVLLYEIYGYKKQSSVTIGVWQTFEWLQAREE